LVFAFASLHLIFDALAHASDDADSIHGDIAWSQRLATAALLPLRAGEQIWGWTLPATQPLTTGLAHHTLGRILNTAIQCGDLGCTAAAAAACRDQGFLGGIPISSMTYLGCHGPRSADPSLRCGVVHQIQVAMCW
jgi:hypothetical protein